VEIALNWLLVNVEIVDSGFRPAVEQMFCIGLGIASAFDVL
jgi:hypothetical protein